jgi:hypothetical protein
MFAILVPAAGTTVYYLHANDSSVRRYGRWAQRPATTKNEAFHFSAPAAERISKAKKQSKSIHKTT